MNFGTKQNPFESAQIVIQDVTGRLFFHCNSSIVKGEVMLTLFGGTVESEDDNAYSRVIQEVKEEAGVVLSRESLRKVCEDGPNEYEKGWFLAQIYFVLVSKGTGDMLAQHPDTEVFNSSALFNESKSSDWKDFAGVERLVDKALELWN